MFNWVCRKLAECFNTHLTERERQYKEDLNSLRKAADEFNRCVAAMEKHDKYTTTWINYGNPYGSHRSRDFNRPKSFRIGKIEGKIVQIKGL